jgi:uncharacterized damage-inducible protein DinB
VAVCGVARLGADFRGQNSLESGQSKESYLLSRRDYSPPLYIMQANDALTALVRQINHVLSQLSPDDYRRSLREFEGSTLGQHFRHALEFFQCLERGAGTGLMDYAARERNLLYETNPRLTAEAFEHFAKGLEMCDLQQPVEVRAEFNSDWRPTYPSTLGRELLFVYDHAIHHLAIIKIGLRCHFPNVQTDPDLGVSPSTVKAREMQMQ